MTIDAERQHIAREGMYRSEFRRSGLTSRIFSAISLAGLLLAASVNIRPAYAATIEKFRCPLPVHIDPELRKLSKEELIGRLSKDSTLFVKQQSKNITIQGAASIAHLYRQLYPDQESKASSIASEEFILMSEGAFDQIERAIFEKTDRSFPTDDYSKLITLIENENFFLLFSAKQNESILNNMDQEQSSLIRNCIRLLDNTPFNSKIIRQSIGDFALMGSIMGTIDGPKLNCRIMRRLKAEGLDVSENTMQTACKVSMS